MNSSTADHLGDYIVQSKYARYREDLGRRELWAEGAQRVFDMHRSRFAAVLDTPVLGTTVGTLIDEAHAAYEAKQVLGSLRAAQFGGAAILQNNARIFNCAFTHIDSLQKLAQSLWLLLSGTGVGFSVQRHHVAQIPALPARLSPKELPVQHHVVADTIEGWADALKALVESYETGVYVEFSYHQIRPQGTLLKTSGGRAPGHLPLKIALEQIRQVFDGAIGRQLRPIEVYDCLMYAANAVLSGGIRRSATIALFSEDDDEMRTAKTGDWFTTNPQRRTSNNSALIVRKTGDKATYEQLFASMRQFGEPGFYFAEDTEYGANPCVEIGLAPTMRVTESDITKLRQYGYTEPIQVGDKVSGFQMCNLSTINGAACVTPEMFYELCRHATVIGTLQAAYTDMGYLGPVTRLLTEREALLGVSICGILDRPDVLLRPEVLEAGAEICKQTNAALAAALGINRAARITCVKPEGTASLVLGAGSGVHPHHARQYFRRVQAAKTDPVYQYFRERNPHATEPYIFDPASTDVITFTVTAPEGAVLRKDLGAVEFLAIVKLVQKHWVEPGTAHEEYNPGLRHNVSNTVTVRDDEWDAVQEYIWEHKQHFTGISLLGAYGDKDYQQAPREEVTTPEDIELWDRLGLVTVDYSRLQETEDRTALKDIVACAGGACEI